MDKKISTTAVALASLTVLALTVLGNTGGSLCSPSEADSSQEQQGATGYAEKRGEGFQIQQVALKAKLSSYSSKTQEEVISRCALQDDCLTTFLNTNTAHKVWPQGQPLSYLRYFAMVASQRTKAAKSGNSMNKAWYNEVRSAMQADHPEQLVPTTPVKQQGDRATCYAFSANATIETYLLEHTGIEYDLSEQYIDLYARHRDENATSFLPLTDGDISPIVPIPLEEVMPYHGSVLRKLGEPAPGEVWAMESREIETAAGAAYLPPPAAADSYFEVTGIREIPGDLGVEETDIQLMAALDAGKGINGTINLLEPFDDYAPLDDSEVIELPSGCEMVEEENAQPGEKTDCYGRGLHAVEVVGYRVREGKISYKIKNSWGENWGLDGYGWLSSAYLQQSGWAYGIIESVRRLDTSPSHAEIFPSQVYFASHRDSAEDVVASYPLLIEWYSASGALEATPFAVLSSAGPQKIEAVEEGEAWVKTFDDDPSLLTLLNVRPNDEITFYHPANQSTQSVSFSHDRFLAPGDRRLRILDSMLVRSGGRFLDGSAIELDKYAQIQLWLCAGEEYCVGNLPLRVRIEKNGVLVEEKQEYRASFTVLSLLQQEASTAGSDSNSGFSSKGGIAFIDADAIVLSYGPLSRRIVLVP